MHCICVIICSLSSLFFCFFPTFFWPKHLVFFFLYFSLLSAFPPFLSFSSPSQMFSLAILFAHVLFLFTTHTYPHILILRSKKLFYFNKTKRSTSKDLEFTFKEIAQQEKRIQQYKDEGRDEYDIKKQVRHCRLPRFFVCGLVVIRWSCIHVALLALFSL